MNVCANFRHQSNKKNEEAAMHAYFFAKYLSVLTLKLFITLQAAIKSVSFH